MYRAEDVPSGRNATVEIGGRDRFKFFKRPLAPMIDGGAQTAGSLPLVYRPSIQRAVQPRSQQLEEHPNNVVGMPAQKTVSKFRSIRNETSGVVVQGGTSGSCDVSCQTMYRENDCQTDPFTPDFFVEEGQQPEVLAIMELKYGEGLPAGVGEVEMIDRVQRRKRVEAMLPQGNDEASTNQRLIELEKLEKLEWEEREAHIKHLQDNRLVQMEKALAKRETQREEQSRSRVEALKQTKLQEVERKLHTLQEKRLGTTRKIMASHTNPSNEKEVKDVIKSHVLYGPRHKPVQRSTLVDKVSTANYDVRPTLLTFEEGIQEIERSAAPRIERVQLSKLAPPEQQAINQLESNYKKRKAREVVDHLEHANKIVEQSHQAKSKAANIQDLYRATPRLQRPDTPVLHLQGDGDEEKEEAILLIQRLLRGRAVQNDFYEGKERCHGLIEELQSASSARDANKVWEDEQRRDAFREKQNAVVQSVVDEVQGDVMFGALDYLFKELKRQKEADKVNRIRAMAEKTRKERESVEIGKRHSEAEDNAVAEEQYSAIVHAVNNTASSYVLQLLSSTARRVATRQSLVEEQTHTSSCPPENPLDRHGQESLVCRLIDEFVVPQACSTSTIKQSRQAASLAALDVISSANV